MKKTTTLLFFCALITSIYAQNVQKFSDQRYPSIPVLSDVKEQTKSLSIIWENDFSNAAEWTTEWLPSNPNDGPWVIGTTGPAGYYSNGMGPIASTTAATGFAMYDSDATGNNASGTQDSKITYTGSINCTGHSNVGVQFESYYRKFHGTPYLEISINGGTTWTQYEVHTDLSINGASTNPSIQIINISAVAANQANLKIRFRYIGEWDYAWMVDDVKIYDAPNYDVSLVEARVNFWPQYINYGYSGFFGQIPCSQLYNTNPPIWFSGIIKNDGTQTIIPILNAVVKNDVDEIIYSSSTPYVGTLTTGARDTLHSGEPYFTFSPSSPTDYGTYTFEISSSLQGNIDENIDNNTISYQTIITSNIYAHDNNNITGQWSTGNYTSGGIDGDIVGVTYPFFATSDVNSVDVYIGSMTEVGTSYIVKIMTKDEGNYWVEATSSALITIETNDQVGIMHTITFPDTYTVNVPESEMVEILVAVEIYFIDSEFRVGVDATVPTSGFETWMYFAGEDTWYYFGGDYVPIIRLNIGNVDCSTTVNLGNDVTQCGGSVTLNAGAGYNSYTWNGVSGDQTYNANSTGNYTVIVTDSYGCTATDVVNVTINPIPTVNLGNDITQCGGTVSLNAGADFSSYNWNGSPGNQIYSVSSSGLYTVVVSNSYGCTASDQIQVNINPIPTVNLGSDITQCGGSVTLDAGVGFTSYNWNGVAGTRYKTVSTSGNYTVIVGNSYGCTATDAVQVTINPAASVNLGNDIEQCGGSVTLDAGAGFTSYTWNGVIGTRYKTINSSGNYSVVVQNSYGCSATDAITITINPVPTVSLSMTQESNNGASDGSATAIATGGTPPYQYLWSNDGVGETITNLTNGLYCVQVSDANGCTATECITVTVSGQSNPPTAQFSADQTEACGSLVVQFTDQSTNNPTVWQWNFGDGSPVSNLQHPQHNYTTPGTYSVSLFVENNDGENELVKTNYITVHQDVLISLSMTPATGEFNADGTADVTVNTGSAPFEYTWSNSANSANITGLLPGEYCVTVEDDNGCIADNCITITYSGQAYADFEADETEGCSPLTVQFTDLSTGNPIAWTWNFGDGATSSEQNPQHIYTAEGSYNVLLVVIYSDATDSKFVSDYITVSSAPELSFEVTPESSEGAHDGAIEITITGGTPPYTINWSNLQHTEVITGLTSGTYYVEVIDANGCTTIDNVTVSVLSSLSVNISSNIAVFPNPTSTDLTIEFVGNTSNSKVEIFNTMGQIVFSGNIIDKTLVHTSDFASGVYLIKIENDQNFVYKKFIKE